MVELFRGLACGVRRRRRRRRERERRLTSTRKQRSTRIVVWRRLGAQMCQDDRHVALSDTKLAVQHHQVCELAHDGVVAVVFMCVAG
jgi:hypothetical protein